MVEKIVSVYLEYLNIPISKKYFEKLILSHPNYPSFLSISDALRMLNIQHEVLKVERKNIKNLAFPYLLQPVRLDKDRGVMKLIRNRKDRAKIEDKNDENFQNAIVIYVEETREIKDNKNQELRSKEALLRTFSYVFILVLLAVFFLLSFEAFSLFQIFLLATAIVGTIISYLIIAKDIGFKNEKIDSFCIAGKKSNCNVVLSSNYASLIGDIKLSDLSISYFIFQLFIIGLFIPLSSNEVTFFWLLSLFSLLTIPVVVYAFYVQYFKTKKWCRLCLIVDFILIIQLYLLYDFQHYNQQLAQISIPLVVISLLFFISIISLVFLLKDKIEKGNRYDRIEIAFNRFRYSKKVFTHLLITQNKQNDISPFSQEMTLGNPNATIKIIQVSNLYCEPCKIEHENVYQLLSQYPNNVNITFRFLRDNILHPNRDDLSTKYLLQHWLQHVKNKEDRSTYSYNLLQEWYSIGSLEKFMNKYQVEDSYKDIANDLAEKHFEWINQADITMTPTFFINGYRVPNSYGIRDLLFLMPVLVESFNEEIKLEEYKF